MQEISAPTPLADPLHCAPIYVDGLMQQEGLFNLAQPTAHIACQCMFKATGWGQQTLSTAEGLRAFYISPLMDAVLMPNRQAGTLLQQLITPIVVTSIVRNLWNTLGGLARGASTKQNLDEALMSDESTGNLDMETSRTDKDKDEITVNRKEEDLMEEDKSERIMEQEKETTTVGNVIKGTMTDLGESKEEETEHSMEQRALLDTIKREPDLAKAVKSDDAEVPKHLWDIAVCHGPPTLEQTKAQSTLQIFMLRIYRKRLWLKIRAYMKQTHGADWTTKMHDAKKNRNTAEEAEGVRNILWQASENKWFQCSVGSRLLFFRFPQRYRTQALRGVRIMFTDKGPSSRRQQPPLKPDEKQVLRKKVKKFLKRGYVAPYQG